MVVRVQDPILIKIDADIEGARRKLVQLKKEFKEVSSGQASAEARSRFNPRNVKIRVPEDHPRSRKALPPRLSLRDGLGALAREGATAFHIGDALAKAMKRSFPVLSAPLLAMEVVNRGVSKTRSTTLGPVLDRFQQDLNELKNLQTLSPGEMELGRLTPERIKKNADVLRKNINDLVVGIEEALKNSAQGIQALRRPNEGVIPDSLIGRANVDQFEALRDALGDIAEIVKDPKLQQQIESVLKRQEFIFRTGREPGRVVPDGLGQPLTDERINPFPQKSSFLDLGGRASRRRVQLAGLGTSDADGPGGGPLFAGLGLDSGAASLAGFAERLAELPGAFVETRERAGGFGSEIDALAERLIGTNLLFGEQSGLLGQLTAQVPELGGAFTTLLGRTSQEAGTLNDVVDVLGRSFLDAFEGAIQRGESLSGVLKGLALDLAEIALKAAGNAFLESILGGLLGGLAGGVGGGGALGPGISPTGGDIFGTPFAKGAAFAPGGALARNIKEFARGGIVDTPEAFAFADGLGIMGEAGPEAILPLARARSGELGVRAMIGRQPAAQAPAAAGPTFNIFAPGADREGFRELMSLIVQLNGKIDRVARSMPAVAIRAWSEHRRRGGFR